MLKYNTYYSARAKDTRFWLDNDYIEGRFDDIDSPIFHRTHIKSMKDFTDKLFRVLAKRGKSVLLYFPELDITISSYEDIMSATLDIRLYQKSVTQLWNDLCLKSQLPMVPKAEAK
jgi:hypothetical protein